MVDHNYIREALLIRRVEESFLDLFSKGKLNGTVHTCVGQEFSAIAFAGKLQKSDFVFSNHRCHGHYLSFTKDVKGLIAELMGKKTGTCGGVGSSQHLCNDNFFSNGIQGGIVPVAAGYALKNKIKNNGQIGIVFIGDGTLGEGVLYETMNIISKWEIPLIIVCENNYYSQSTPQSVNLAGNILMRAEAFGIKTSKSDTWDIEKLLNDAEESINFVRNTSKPLFHLVETYRLNAHSKGDDDRDVGEVLEFKEKDFLNIFSKNEPKLYNKYLDKINRDLKEIIEEVDGEGELLLNEYFRQNEIVEGDTLWDDLPLINKRQVELINGYFEEKMGADSNTVFIGEDVLSPYGGAFKVAKNLSINYPNQVFSTPISEAAIVGIANGLAMAGMKPYAEIMFGDFITLAFDQIVNHSSKFHHIYNGKVNCPIIIRTPMGGKRGYGPTHSQTLDKFLIGIDNVITLALNTLIDPTIIYQMAHTEIHPVIVIENKVDYGKKIGIDLGPNFIGKVSKDKYPIIKFEPINSNPTCTVVTYGTNASWILENLTQFFIETDLIPEVIVLTKIHPIEYKEIIESVRLTKKIFVVEEGSKAGGIGSEIIANIIENIDFPIIARRLGALEVPIPSVKSLETIVLPDINGLINLSK